MKGKLSLTFIVILSASVATAESVDFHADLYVRAANSEGPSRVSGPLVAFIQGQNGQGTGDASPFFDLAASNLCIERDESDPVVHAGAFFAAPMEAVTKTPVCHQNANIEGVMNREGYRLVVSGVDGAENARVEGFSGCMQAQASDSDTLRNIPIVNWRRPATTLDTSRAIEWDCLDGAYFIITGDVRLSLWSWDARLTADGKTEELQSGRFQSAHAPNGAPDGSAVVSQDREIYVFATNATLTVPKLEGRYTLLTGPETTVASGSLTLEGATGKIVTPAGDVEAKYGSLAIQGTTSAVLAGAGVGQAFSIQLSGSPHSISLDGTTLKLVPPAIPQFGMWVYLAAGFTVLLIGGAYYVYSRPTRFYAAKSREEGKPLGYSRPSTRRERRGMGYWALGGNALARDRNALALRYARRAAKLFPTSLDTKTLVGVAEQHCGRPEKALEQYLGLFAEVPSGEERAILCMMCAMANMELERDDEARRWATKASEEDMETFLEEIKHPRYARLVKDDRWLRALQYASYRIHIGWDPSFA